MTVVAYLRVSTDQQDVEAQRVGVAEYVQRLGMAVDEFVEDGGVSGRVHWRKRKLGPLLARLRRGDVLIVAEVSRIARSTLQVLEVLEECTRRGVEAHVVKQGMKLDNSLHNKITLTVLGLAAEIERDLISQRTKEGLALRKAQGVRLGRAPGFKPALKLDAHADEIRTLLGAGVAKQTVARKLGVSRMTLYKWLEARG